MSCTTRAKEADHLRNCRVGDSDDPTGLAKERIKCGVRSYAGKAMPSSRACLFSISRRVSPRALELPIWLSSRKNPCDSEVVGAEDNDGAANQEEGCSLAGGSSPARQAIEIPEVLPYCELSAQAWPASRADVFSYSSIAHGSSDEVEVDSFEDVRALSKVQFVEEPGFTEADETAWTAIRASLSRDADKAADLGTAFHRLAQQAVCAHNEGAPLLCPGKSHVDALARHSGLSDLQRIRLTEALARWFESDVAARVVTFSLLRAEVPFFVRVGHGADAPFMEGEIDLLADGEDGRTALVVDYKR